MKIIHTLPWLVPEAGGPVRSVTQLCSHLGSRDISVHLLTLDFGRKFAAPILPTNQVNTTFAPCKLAMGLNAVWAPQFSAMLNKICEDHKLTVLHDHGLWLVTNHITASQAKKKQIPLILSTRGMLEPWSLQNSIIKKQLAWRLYQQRNLEIPQVLHATSIEEAENLRQLKLKQPIAIISNGVELPSNGYKPKKTREKHGHTLLFLSRIHPKKGLIHLINALALVHLPDWQLTIAGPDENNHQCEVEAAIHTAGLQNKVTFLGAVDDEKKWQVYQQADLFVLPTFSENFGIVVAEALAAGVPVITTKGTPWQDLETHHCGWWTDIGIEPLAKVLKIAMNLTDQERIIMGQNGRRLVEQKYSWSDAAQKMTSVYRWMLGEGDKPNCIWD